MRPAQRECGAEQGGSRTKLSCMKVCKTETKEDGELCSLIRKALRQRQSGPAGQRCGRGITSGRQNIAEPYVRCQHCTVIACPCSQHPLECPAGVLQAARGSIRLAQPHQQRVRRGPLAGRPA